MWNDVLVDIGNDLKYLIRLLEDVRVDIKDLYNLNGNTADIVSEISSNTHLLEENIDKISSNVGKLNNKNVKDYQLYNKIDNLNNSIDDLDSKIDKNNELLAELIKVLKEKN